MLGLFNCADLSSNVQAPPHRPHCTVTVAVALPLLLTTSLVEGEAGESVTIPGLVYLWSLSSQGLSPPSSIHSFPDSMSNPLPTPTLAFPGPCASVSPLSMWSHLYTWLMCADPLCDHHSHSCHQGWPLRSQASPREAPSSHSHHGHQRPVMWDISGEFALQTPWTRRGQTFYRLLPPPPPHQAPLSSPLPLLLETCPEPPHFSSLGHSVLYFQSVR